LFIQANFLSKNNLVLLLLLFIQADFLSKKNLVLLLFIQADFLNKENNLVLLLFIQANKTKFCCYLLNNPLLSVYKHNSYGTSEV